MTAKTPAPQPSYASSVVQVLRDHTSWLSNATDAELVAELIEEQVRDPKASFEVIVDNPYAARWRLKARSDDRARVRLAYCPVTPPGSDAGNALERTVNDALRALERAGYEEG